MWQVGLLVDSKVSVVDNSLLGSVHRKTKTIIDHHQASSRFELVSNEEQIRQQLHDVRFGNGLLVNLANLNISGSSAELHNVKDMADISV